MEPPWGSKGAAKSPKNNIRGHNSISKGWIKPISFIHFSYIVEFVRTLKASCFKSI